MSPNRSRPLLITSTLALCSLASVACTTTSSSGRTDVASSKATIDNQFDAALARLYTEVPGAREAGATAWGILVFPANRGWTAGVDAAVAVANVGANGSIDTASMRQPVVGFVMANAGLEIGASLQGMKVTELEL